MSALHLKADVCGALAHVCFGPIADMQNFYSKQKTPSIAPGLSLQTRRLYVATKILARLKCASGTAELGSCLTDAIPRAVPGVPFSICRYPRRGRLALAIVAALLIRWYHLQGLRV
jgi:hypothetical protein